MVWRMVGSSSSKPTLSSQVHIIDMSVRKLSLAEGLILLHLLSGADGDVIAVRSLKNVIMCKITARPRGLMQ
jgi:hypothetical protein